MSCLSTVRPENEESRSADGPSFEIVPFTSISERIWTQWDLPAANPAMDQAWVEAAVEVHCNGEADVIVAGSLDQPDGYAILCPATSRISGLRNLGDSVTSEATPMVARDDQALASLAQGFAALGQAVNFGHYPVADGFPRHLRSALRGRGLVLTKPSPQRAWPSLSLVDGWRALDARMSGSRRQTLNRKWRKAEKLGNVRVEIITPGPEDSDMLMRTAFDVQGRSWKGDAGTALSKTPLQAEFFRSFGRRAAALRQLRMCFLHIGDKVAAMQIAMAWRGRFWSISIGYDAAFGACSPGELLTRELIRAAAEDGYKSFEFCGKEADWTLKWTDKAVDVASLRIYPLSSRGLITLVHDASRTMANRLR